MSNLKAIPGRTRKLSVLVVDDEEAIREVATKILEMGGYKVITANDGTEALGEFVQHQQEIRLVITDILMPYMDGIALIRSLRQIEPSVTIIAASGQEADAEFLTTAGIKVEKFLPKPFTAETLLSAIYSVLHKTQT